MNKTIRFMIFGNRDTELGIGRRTTLVGAFVVKR